MVIKAVIFDMDGVLVDSMKYHIKSWIKSFWVYGIPVTEEEIALMEGSNSLEIIEHFSKKYKVKLTKKDKEKLYSIKTHEFDRGFRFRVYPHAYKLLDLLKRKGIHRALVTGGNKKLVGKIIRKEFKGYFEAVVTGDDTKKAKPHPEPYLRGLKKLGFKPSEVIVVENAPLGIKSAKRAKIKNLALCTTLDRKYLRESNKIFSNHKELLKYFEKLLN